MVQRQVSFWKLRANKVYEENPKPARATSETLSRRRRWKKRKRRRKRRKKETIHKELESFINSVLIRSFVTTISNMLGPLTEIKRESQNGINL